MSDMVRKHFTMPRELAEEFERRVGQRNQSEQLTHLVEAWLKKQRLLNVVDTFAGFISAEDHPEWATAEDVNEWVRLMRSGSRDPWALTDAEADPSHPDD
jgi:hypothetical protein